MPYVDLPGVHLWYTDTGEGVAPVVFTHPASGTSESWEQQMPAFEAAGYRCIALDRRGWGRSIPDPKAERPGYSSDDLAALADHLRLDRFHIVSTGGGCASGVDYTLLHPQRVRSLIVSDCTATVQDPEYDEVVKRIQAKEIMSLPVQLRELSPTYRGANPEGLRRFMEIERAAHQEGAPGPRPRTRVTFALLEELQVPVLLLFGGADLFTPPMLARELAAHIPNAELAIIPEAGHDAFWEQPDEWNRLALAFIGKY